MLENLLKGEKRLVGASVSRLDFVKLKLQFVSQTKATPKVLRQQKTPAKDELVIVRHIKLNILLTRLLLSTCNIFDTFLDSWVSLDFKTIANLV